MKKLFKWLRKEEQEDEGPVMIGSETGLHEVLKAAPKRSVEVPQELLDATDTLKILDVPELDTAKEESSGADPYNTGVFNKAKIWGGIKKR